MQSTNLRPDPSTGFLVVTGMPEAVATIPARHLLALVDGDNYITYYNGRLWLDSTALCSVSGALLGAFRVGKFVVVAGTGGTVLLTGGDGAAYAVASRSQAMPSITIAARAGSAAGTAVSAVAFAEPYSRWQAPLAAADVTALAAAMRQAWNTVTALAEAGGAQWGTRRYRYALRLWDDSYLAASEAVTLGATATAPSVTVQATTDGSSVTGTPAATLTLPTFTPSITVAGGVPAAWRGVVKAIDILATEPVSPVRDASTLTYRAYSSSQRPMLEMSLAARGAAQVEQVLAASRWTVVDSTTDLDALSRGQWVGAATLPAISLTAGECDALATEPAERALVAALVCNGRLYAADSDGLMTTSRPANPLVTERSYTVTGAAVTGLAAVPRSLYSGGFGRYPVYLFTTEGIFALPLTTQGAYGEPRLLSRALLAGGTRPMEGGRDVYFTSSGGHLCRLRGSEVTVMARQAAMREMVWDAEHSELWCLDGSGRLWALTTDDHLDRRTLDVAGLWGTVGAALAVEAGGTVRDLGSEATAMMEVEWLSDPEPVAGSRGSARRRQAQPAEVLWQVYGDEVSLRLDVLGERGVSCHGFLVNRMTVRGRLGAPLRAVLVSPPLRTLRRHITGSAATATLIGR